MTKSMPLPRSLPEKEGIYSRYIIDLINEIELRGIELHSMIITANGRVVFEGHSNPYAPDIPHCIHSMTKVLTNTAVGVAYSQGLLNLEEKVVDFFPDQVPVDANDYLQEMTVKNLITMRCGHGRGISGNEWRPIKTSWINQFFKEPVIYKPGEVFRYSSAPSYILSAIVQKLTGLTAHQYLQKYFVSEIGMKEFTWDLSPEGICSGGNGISLCIEDIARLGMLYLQHGQWNGKQVIAESWVDRSFGLLDPVERREKDPIYNYHWIKKGNLYDASGMFGQRCVIVPDLEMVIGITSAHSDIMAGRGAPFANRNVTDIINEFLVDPLINDKERNYDSRYAGILIHKGECLNLLKVPRSVKSKIDFAQGNMIFSVDRNEDHISRISVDFDGDTVTFGMTDHRGTHTVKCGLNCWVKDFSSITGNYLHHQYQPEKSMIVGAAYWESSDTLAMEWRYPEMAFCDYVTLRFQSDEVFMERSVNVNSQSLNRPRICGKLI